MSFQVNRASIPGDSTTAEIRNDPTYRTNRRAKLEKSILVARDNKSVLITVARLDQDVRDLAATHNVPIYLGNSPPKGGEKGAIFWYPFAAEDKIRYCRNPICAMVHGGLCKLQRCSCKKMEYCSKICQRAHWSVHKPDCTHPQ
jgi:hypothetical protein